MHEHGVFSSDFAARFCEIVEEAIWRWEDCTIALPGIDGKMHDIYIDKPVIVEAERLVHYGGTAFGVTMNVALSMTGKDAASLGPDYAFE